MTCAVARPAGGMTVASWLLAAAAVAGGWLLAAIPLAVWVGRRLHDMQPPPNDDQEDEAS